MRPTFLLLQLANAIIAGAAAYVYYHAPGLWLDQAQLYFGLAGVAVGVLTALICGASLLFGKGEGGASIHGLLGLAFIGAQAYWLWHFGVDAGILNFVRRAFNL